jgi:hypothetical protein
MTEPEEPPRTEVPSEERVKQGVEQDTGTREAPIDHDVSGELNAALPDETEGEAEG